MAAGQPLGRASIRKPEHGDYTARLAQLGTLDDAPVVVLPLQYATLLQTEREGPLAYRAVMVTLGDAKLRDGEKLASAGAIERIADDDRDRGAGDGATRPWRGCATISTRSPPSPPSASISSGR